MSGCSPRRGPPEPFTTTARQRDSVQGRIWRRLASPVVWSHCRFRSLRLHVSLTCFVDFLLSDLRLGRLLPCLATCALLPRGGPRSDTSWRSCLVRRTCSVCKRPEMFVGAVLAARALGTSRPGACLSVAAFRLACATSSMLRSLAPDALSGVRTSLGLDIVHFAIGQRRHGNPLPARQRTSVWLKTKRSGVCRHCVAGRFWERGAAPALALEQCGTRACPRLPPTCLLLRIVRYCKHLSVGTFLRLSDSLVAPLSCPSRTQRHLVAVSVLQC